MHLVNTLTGVYVLPFVVEPTTVLDGFVATFVGDSVITSHNQNFISQVPTGTAEVYVRTDSRYGPFHATILPRPHLEHYPILTKLFMELPIKVASQRHSTGYMYLQPKQVSAKPGSPVANCQLTKVSPTKHISSMPSSDDCVLPDKPSYKQHLMPTPAALLPSRQGLEHEAAAASLPNNSLQQQQLPPPPSPPPESALQMITTRMAEKKQVIACLFCRERQNRRGQSHHESEGRTCM